MSWISGPCNDEPERDEEQEERDERKPRETWAGASHFHAVLGEGNQREYPRRPRGTARDAE